MAKKQKGKNSLNHQILRRFFRNKAALLGLVYMLVLLFAAVFADKLFDYDTIVIRNNISERLIPPCAAHWFGTDDLGRDIFARVVHGARLSLTISFSAVALALVVGGIIGLFAAYYGGFVDEVLMRLTDIFIAVPTTLMCIILVAALGSSSLNLILALGLASMPTFARVVRSAVLTVRDEEYITSARALGARDSEIVTKHVLPNCMGPILVQTTLRIASAIYNTSALSFLGLGIAQPAPEWGGMLSAGRNYIRTASYVSLIPGLAIMLTVLALNLMGDGIRDAIDPKLK